MKKRYTVACQPLNLQLTPLNETSKMKSAPGRRRAGVGVDGGSKCCYLPCYDDIYSRVNSFETQVDVEGLRHISVLGHGINCQLTPQISRVFVGTFGFAWCRGWGRRRRWRRRWWGRCWGVRVVATGRSIFLLNWAIWFLARVACSIKSNKAGRRTKAHGNHHNRVNLNVEF